MLRLSLCNELLAAEGLAFAEQCAVAAALGYMGLELAPETLAANGAAPHRLPGEVRARLRAEAEAHGLRITGLHWLLKPYPGLSITEPRRAAETVEVLCALVDLCADLGGDVLVHGSPKQRVRPEGMGERALRAHLGTLFAPVAERAEERGVRYCIEPLARNETSVINTVAEAAELVDAVGSPAFRTMIDCSAAGRTEDAPVAGLVARWVPTGLIGHVHMNETGRGAPGTGDDPFPEIVAALVRAGWDRPVGVEPFEVTVSGSVTAAIGAATLRACERAMEGRGEG